MCIQGGGLEGYVFFCDNLYRGFTFLTFIFFSFLNPVCLFIIIISLNAFVVALMFFLH